MRRWLHVKVLTGGRVLLVVIGSTTALIVVAKMKLMQDPRNDFHDKAVTDLLVYGFTADEARALFAAAIMREPGAPIMPVRDLAAVTSDMFFRVVGLHEDRDSSGKYLGGDTVMKLQAIHGKKPNSCLVVHALKSMELANQEPITVRQWVSNRRDAQGRRLSGEFQYVSTTYDLVVRVRASAGQMFGLKVGDPVNIDLKRTLRQ